MSSREDVVGLAESNAAKGFLCSESVLLAISKSMGIQSELIPKIATGFGAGVGGGGLICGALSGGIMALGLRFGRNHVEEQRSKPYSFAVELLRRFEEEHGYVNCRDLTGCDFRTEAGQKKYEDQKMWDKRCRQFIASVTGITFDLLFEKPSQIRHPGSDM